MTRSRIADELLSTERLQREMAALSQRIGEPLVTVQKRVRGSLHEMVAVQSPVAEWALDKVLGPLHSRAWSLDSDAAELRQLAELNETQSLVFLPTHRSYADAFVLTAVLQHGGLPRNYILGGDNLSFFPLGAIGRRAGGIFIRRSFKGDEPYKLAVREYLRHLVASRFNLEWYMEGGRSRTGKLRPPRYGLLQYLAEALESGASSDVLLVPVSITYDQLQEVGAIAADDSGQHKAKEGIAWLASYARKQGQKLGKVYVRFAAPLSLRQALNGGSAPTGVSWTVDKVAFEVFQRINRVTPVTGAALVTLALLGSRLN